MPSRLRKIGRLRLVFGLGLLLLSVGTLVVFLEIFNVDLIAIYYHSLKPLGIVAMTLGTLIALGAKLVDVRHKMLLIKELRKTLHEQQKQEWDRSLKWKYEDALYRAGLSSKVRGGDSLRWPYEVIVEPTLKEIVEINGEAHKYQRTQITDRSREDESNGPNSVHPGAILVILFAVFLALPPEGQAFILFLVVVALMIMGSIYLINHWDEVANRLDAMRDAVSVDNAAWVIGRIVQFFSDGGADCSGVSPHSLRARWPVCRI